MPEVRVLERAGEARPEEPRTAFGWPSHSRNVSELVQIRERHRVCHCVSEVASVDGVHCGVGVKGQTVL